MIENAKARRERRMRSERNAGLRPLFAFFARFVSSRSQSKAVEEQAKIEKLIVGLGNPGKEYEETRHNVGFRVVELLAERHGIALKKHRHQAQYGEGRIGGVAVLLAKPLTYMNNSGAAVAALARYHNLAPADTLVVTDDVNLPLGRLRLRAQGTAGGHNGLKSIIGALGTPDFPRLRIGVGAPESRGLVDHVLGRFSRAEGEAVAALLAQAADTVELLLREGTEAAMNRFNVGEPRERPRERKKAQESEAGQGPAPEPASHEGAASARAEG
jgi:PTH1 family peptidyl-tRNA hydrolase